MSEVANFQNQQELRRFTWCLFSATRQESTEAPPRSGPYTGTGSGPDAPVRSDGWMGQSCDQPSANQRPARAIIGYRRRQCCLYEVGINPLCSLFFLIVHHIRKTRWYFWGFILHKVSNIFLFLSWTSRIKHAP